MTAHWVRSNYHVPAKRGGRVAYTGDPQKGRQLGTITRFSSSVHVRLDGEKHSAPYHPTWEIEYLPSAEWTLSRENLAELWDGDGIKVHCKPHFAPLLEPRQLSADRVISTVVDGLTIGAHRGKPRQVARFGDRITLDADGTYTVHPAASTALES